MLSDRISLIAARVGLAVACLFAALAVLFAAGRWQLLPVLSGSMSPGMAVGDLAITRPIHAKDIRLGQVVAYNAPIEGQPLVIHRVIQLRRDGDDTVMLTKGDANSAPDTWTARLPAHAIVMARETSVPGLGRPVHTLASIGTYGLLLITITITGGMLVLSWIWKPRTALDEEDGHEAPAI